ncbi:MAG: peptide chain release factor N(5)-glutamine methyltransferase [Clostridiales Family XIII bacterium]|jgi:release factor glutamine methyltransferase|nr:peptide chain release factor N(5)-glutamine methyltransferase [Clostridiales Family XIII bacterium]
MISQHNKELLLCYVLGIDRAGLFLRQSNGEKLDGADRARYEGLASRVLAGEPVQYVTGEAYFMGHRFAVDPAVLIPRPETEVLCDMAIRDLTALARARASASMPAGEGAPALCVLDLCTGSGALAVSIALAVPEARVTASDISADALSVARMNAQELGASDRIHFLKSDLLADLHGRDGDGAPVRYDLIVTNPPYIPTGDIADLQREVRDHEPMTALDGGTDGLDFYRRIAAEAGGFLADGGTLLAEIGWDQGAQVKAALEAAGFFEVSVFQDLAGRDRIVRAAIS